MLHTRRKWFMWRCAFVPILLNVAVLGCGQAYDGAGKGKREVMKVKPYPGKSRMAFDAKRVNVRVSNPRNKGFEDSPVNAPNTKTTYYRIQMFQIVLLKDGTFVSPVMLVTRPRKSGVWGGVKMEDQWSDVTTAIVADSASSLGSQNFPVGDDIHTLFLVLKALDEETDLRVLELQPESISEHDAIEVPDLLELPRLEDHSDGKLFVKLRTDASTEEEHLQE